MNPLVICLIGPTASGKTQIAVELAQKYPVEIISVDASMIYRGMDIGTAKPDKETLNIAPHRLIDIRDPAKPYSAGQFCQDAVREIEDILSKGKIPLLVGGTMLYFHSLTRGLSELPEKNLAVREAIDQEAAQVGWPKLHERLAKIDPVAAQRIHQHDTQRISRALEIYQITDKPWSSFIEKRQSYLAYPVVNFALWIEDKQNLNQRITERFDTMLTKGFIEEVEKLMQRGDLSDATPAMRAVGYRQVWRYLKGELHFDEMREQGIIATRQLAKRQLTWLRKLEPLSRFEPKAIERVLEMSLQ